MAGASRTGRAGVATATSSRRSATRRWSSSSACRRKPGVRIWAKLESHNPTGSVKDRVARAMIEDAEEKGAIQPGQTILEPTSGNTGISLAMICRRKGYPLKVVMPENVTPERTQLLRDVRRRDRLLARAPRAPTARSRWRSTWPRRDASYYMPYQYGNQANPLAHYNGTAPEILEELDEVAAFVAGLGTGGTLMGNGRRLKEELGDAVKIVAAEPMQGEPVQGLRSLDDGFIPPIIDLSLLDRKIFVTNRDAIVWTRRLLDEEGIFAGVSSGAIASIAVRIAGELDEGNVVFIVCDDGWKYLSSGHLHQAGRRDRGSGLHRLVVIRPRRRGAQASMTASLRAARAARVMGVVLAGSSAGVARRLRRRRRRLGRAERAARSTGAGDAPEPRGTAGSRRRRPAQRRARPREHGDRRLPRGRAGLGGEARLAGQRLLEQERAHADALAREAIRRARRHPTPPARSYSFRRCARSAALRFDAGREHGDRRLHARCPRLSEPDPRGRGGDPHRRGEHLAVVLSAPGAPSSRGRCHRCRITRDCLLTIINGDADTARSRSTAPRREAAQHGLIAGGACWRLGIPHCLHQPAFAAAEGDDDVSCGRGGARADRGRRLRGGAAGGSSTAARGTRRAGPGQEREHAGP